ncbi:hypothetical protein G7054_g1266 [Neopestalotiopsis clavispora]|nr:hypothetical protein G7054_g1266 [Neopestalotiopsis clavispora]
MRLLHHLGDGHFRLEDFAEDNKPNYAILSHTWLVDGSEVTFDDLEKGNTQNKTASYNKIQFCVKQAAKDGLDYSWVDTCCINKSSSAELQEAITIMFNWYRDAAKCYVYLSDVSATERGSAHHPVPWELAFRQSRWFKRGWTLQELIAPKTVEFFSSQGVRLGDKNSLSDMIHQVTEIPHQALQGADMDVFSIAERLSWMQDRQTKRKEDMAYSVLGILGIFMPLMYGEGTHALTRLHEEIHRKRKTGARVNEMLSKLPAVPQAAFNSIENQYAATCLPNTRVELLQEIIDWVDGSDKRCIFWLNGIAGTGKSTVAQTISRRYQDRGNLGGSFFFSKGGGDSSLADKFITTLAFQLSTKIPQVKQFIHDAIAQQPNIAAHSLRDQWDQLILKPLSRLNKHAPSTILFVIDALDECASERDIRIILKLITSSQSLTNIRLRILITSRPETPIRCGFSHISKAERQIFVLHEILPAIVDRDLGLFFEHNFMALREERGFADDWPGTQFIKRLVEISGGLFIWASTACRYIREGRRLATRRISTLVNGHSSGMGPEKQLDQIYTTVLRAAIEQGYSDLEKKELYGLLREVLGSITILFSPLSINSLSNLIPASSSDINETLADLHTIFRIPDQMDRVIRFHHPTFRDFLFNRQRCSDLNFWVDEKQAHKAMAENCIQLMSKVLKRDICGLQLPGTLLEDIEPKLIKERITPELEYACRYWVQHYRESGTVLRDGDEAHLFFEEFFLNWLECMTLTGNASEVPSIIRSYASLLVESDNIRQWPFVQDSRRFLLAFQSVLEVAPLQTYCAALAFSPRANRLRGHFWGQMRRWIHDVQLAGGVGDEISGPKTSRTFFANSISFTPDGAQLASGSVESLVRLWDVATRSKLGVLTGPENKVSSVTVSPNGCLIAAASDDASVMIWELATRTLRFILRGHSRWVNSVGFSPNGKMLVSGGMDDTIRLWDVETGQELCKLDANSSGVSSVTFSPDSRTIASGSVDRVVRIWDFKRHETVTLLDGHSGAVNCVVYSPDGKLIVSGADDATVKLWDTRAGAEYMTLRGHKRRVMTTAISPNGRVIASGSEDSQIMLWNANTGVAIAKLNGHKSGINAVAFSPDGRSVASCSFDSQVKLWNAIIGEPAGNFEEFGEDDFPTSTSTKNMTLLDPKATNPPKIFNGHSSTITTLTRSSAGNLVASGSHDTQIKLWSREGTQLALLQGHSDTISCLEFSPNNQWLASASIDRKACLWDVATGTIRYTLQGHDDAVSLVRFSSDGKLLVSCSNDKTAILWDTETGTNLRQLEGHADALNDVRFRPSNNSFLASCSADMTIKLWDLSSGTICRTLMGHSDTVNSVAFSWDGALLVSSSADTSVRLWDIYGAAHGILKGHRLPVHSAAFSPDGKLIVSCSDDRTIKIWDIETGLTVHEFKFKVVVHYVQFSSCGRYIKTDRGVLALNSSSDTGARHSVAELQSALFASEHWVMKGGQDFLWLPDDYQATCVAAQADTMALGHASGGISFLCF